MNIQNTCKAEFSINIRHYIELSTHPETIYTFIIKSRSQIRQRLVERYWRHYTTAFFTDALFICHFKQLQLLNQDLTHALSLIFSFQALRDNEFCLWQYCSLQLNRQLLNVQNLLTFLTFQFRITRWWFAFFERSHQNIFCLFQQSFFSWTKGEASA